MRGDGGREKDRMICIRVSLKKMSLRWVTSVAEPQRGGWKLIIRDVCGIARCALTHLLTNILRYK